MTCSFHLHTFWHHVTWNHKGTEGKDQHGMLWFNIKNPRNEAGQRPIKVDHYDSEAMEFIKQSKTVLV